MDAPQAGEEAADRRVVAAAPQPHDALPRRLREDLARLRANDDTLTKLK